MTMDDVIVRLDEDFPIAMEKQAPQTQEQPSTVIIIHTILFVSFYFLPYLSSHKTERKQKTTKWQILENFSSVKNYEENLHL